MEKNTKKEQKEARLLAKKRTKKKTKKKRIRLDREKNSGSSLGLTGTKKKREALAPRDWEGGACWPLSEGDGAALLFAALLRFPLQRLV